MPRSLPFVVSALLMLSGCGANATDNKAAAEAAAVQTTGIAVAAGPAVQLVDAAEFNDIDRKADDRAAQSIDRARGDDAGTHNGQANTSWLQWIWSAVVSIFTA